MKSTLLFTIRFLHPLVHTRGDGGDPEWPPSPLRLVQSLVAAAAGRWNERLQLVHAKPAIQWLESLPRPEIIAAQGVASEVPTQFYVPDNTTEMLVPAWKKGEWDKAPKRTEKVVRPTHLLGDTLHYLFPLPGGQCPHLETLQSAARSITHLGWGIDMVAGDAAVITSDEADKLPGHRWRETPSGGVPLRVPMAGTLDDLIRKHTDFLQRISDEGFRPVPPLRNFRVARYHSATAGSSELPTRPWCAFNILSPDLSRNAVFNTMRRTRDVAAWVRHATGEACRSWPDKASYIHGHDEHGKQIRGDGADQRLMFLPLPTINPLNRVESIRRVLITAPPGDDRRIADLRRRLPSHELRTPEGAVVGVLSPVPAGDWVVRQYTGVSRVWSSVTPVILPGHDDHDPRKAEQLLRKALVQAGLPREVVAGAEALHWRSVGFRAGVELARRYERAGLPRGPMYHVQVRLGQAVAGPLAVGAGRYRGFGLFAAEGESA